MDPTAYLLLLCLAPAPQPVATEPSFEPVEDQEGLPRVLLIGDSISMGYTLPVRKRLEGKANVHRPAVNCGPTIRALQHLDAWLGDGKWDVIHFNFGLHDLRMDAEGKHQVTVEDYEKNIGAIIERLEQTGAKLVWCATTPVPEGNLKPPRLNSDVIAYNEAAGRAIEGHDIAVDDLYAYALPKLQDIQIPENVHFTGDGYEVLAGQVAASLCEALGIGE